MELDDGFKLILLGLKKMLF